MDSMCSTSGKTLPFFHFSFSTAAAAAAAAADAAAVKRRAPCGNAEDHTEGYELGDLGATIRTRGTVWADPLPRSVYRLSIH